MASHPPLHVEDQTDEDFFDKLVADDFSATESSGPASAVGNDIDEAKAFTNLGLGEVGTGFDDSVGQDKEKKISCGDNGESTGQCVDRSDSRVPSNVAEVYGSIESENGGMGTDNLSDAAMNQSSGSTGSGVKEVQWSLFNADSKHGSSGGFGSYSDFFSELEGDGSREFPEKAEEKSIETKLVQGNEEPKNDELTPSIKAGVNESVELQDSGNNWENLYPGWMYDPNTQQWFQVDNCDATANVHKNFDANASVRGNSDATANVHESFDANASLHGNFDVNANVHGNFDANAAGAWAGSDGNLEASYMQRTVPSVAGTVIDSGTNANVSNWNQVTEVSNEYPEHMVFDPQYPGWYYDTIAQEWRTLEAYTSSMQQTVTSESQRDQNGFASAGIYPHNHDHGIYGEGGEANKQGLQGHGIQRQDYNWSGSYVDYNQHSTNTWQPDTVAKSQTILNSSGNHQYGNSYVSNASINGLVNQQKSYNSIGTVPSYENANQASNSANGFIHGGNFSQQFNQSEIEHSKQVPSSNDYYVTQNAGSFSQLQNTQQFPYTSNVGRSSAGRPPHALVTFGFGGKLIVLKSNDCSSNTSYGNQDPTGVVGSISVHNLLEVVPGKTDASTHGVGGCNYFHSLCQQSFPGPLVGGNVGSKELNKWIDERVANNDSVGMDFKQGESLRVLLSLLKIACQHYGKLRSPFGTDTALRENESPDSAVAKLFASAKRHGGQLNAYGTIAHCLQNFPSEGQIRATAAEVQSLLVSGRTKEALHSAQEGQLWGPALVLAAQLGDHFYVDTVKQMALRQLVAGSPLRTLCLLIAGQHADVFSTDATADNGYAAAASMQQSGQLGINVMLDDWEENLAVITANRTKDDELVLIHLGDCLWKERSEIVAAHICYLVAEANFEPYSDSARLCLIGADHLKFPRTFASPEAIQRTEIYEYSKALGNSQYTLLPFQPYKLLYAHMLAEVGKVSEALKYCQAIFKCIKTGRAPEVETWKQLVSSLEERLKTHQQGGFATNLAPKLVGKLLNLFDSTAHRVVGGLPPVPSTSQIAAQDNGHYYQAMPPRVSTSQSTMAMSSLMPSESMEPVSEWTADGNHKPRHNRSVSEPDFGRTPRQVDSSKVDGTSNAQGNNPSGSGGTSRFVRFGFGSQLFQKMGLVLKRSERQAKLGEKNKFYYDEKLKRWVEEGAELPTEEAALPPPPTTSSYQNGMSDYTLKNALKNEGYSTDRSPQSKNASPMEFSSGIPPVPPSSNQFSARGRTGVRSRYVDTFNQGNGTPANLFQSPSVPSTKTAVGANAKFFIPASASSPIEETRHVTTESVQEPAATTENPSISGTNGSYQSPAPPSSAAMQRFPSMDNIPNKSVVTNDNGSLSSHSRRTASWSGSFSDAFSPPKRSELKPLGEALGMPPSTFIPNDTSMAQLQMNGGNLGDDLHEVEL